MTSEQTDLKSKLLKSSKKLFWKHGIKRVTVEEICENASVSKMSFYRHFKNKDTIAEALLEQVFRKSIKKYTKIMQSDDDFRIKVSRIVKNERENSKNISEEFVDEILKKEGSSIQNKLNELQQDFLKTLKQDFIHAQENGDIRKDLNIDFMMYMLNDINTKLLDKELKKLYKTEEDLIMELTNFFFYGILP